MDKTTTYTPSRHPYSVVSNGYTFRTEQAGTYIAALRDEWLTLDPTETQARLDVLNRMYSYPECDGAMTMYDETYGMSGVPVSSIARFDLWLDYPTRDFTNASLVTVTIRSEMESPEDVFSTFGLCSNNHDTTKVGRLADLISAATKIAMSDLHTVVLP